MNLFERIILGLQSTMEEPQAFGWFHIMCILIMLAFIVFLYFRRNKYSEKELKRVLAIYGITALILEILKQITWSFNYENGVVSWSYLWYSAPFQLCSTPIYVSIICLFLKKGKLRTSLFSYLAYFTILGSLSVIFLPDSCLVETILVNIHTMFLHLGSFVVSIFLMMHEVKPNIKNFINSYKVFLCFVLVALLLDIIIYNSGILNGDTFNMFYITPYFTSSLPVYDKIQSVLPYVLYLLFYIVSLGIGASIIALIHRLIARKTLQK